MWTRRSRPDGPRRPSLSGGECSALVEGWLPELVDRARRQSSWPAIEAHRGQIKARLGTVTVSTIHCHRLSVSERRCAGLSRRNAAS